MLSRRIQLASPAVLGRVEGPDLPLGDPLRVRLVRASPGTARPLFIPA
ncbi:hypothetical protein ACPCBC_09505 [Streptomyces incarnatus]